MGAPIGNNNGKGKKGKSGRKSAFQELSDAKRLKEQWTSPNAVKEARIRVRTGDASLEDMFLMIAADGNVSALIKYFERFYPEKRLLMNMAKEVSELSKEEREKIDRIFEENS